MTKTGKQPIRKVYILPNLFTAFNMFLGLAAIYNIYLAQVLAQPNDHFTKACWFLILAGVLDGLDGAVARLTNTQSAFGVQFDSLSDLVSFGVAPSFAAFHLMHNMAYVPDRLLVGICGFYALCGALRLARYNIQAETSSSGGFAGLPIPGSAGGVVFIALLIHHYDLTSPAESINLLSLVGYHLTVSEIVPILLPFCVIACALLMVSEIPYPSMMKKICLKREISFDTLVSGILLATVAWVLSHDERVALMFILGYTYIFYSPLIALVRRCSKADASAENFGETKL